MRTKQKGYQMLKIGDKYIVTIDKIFDDVYGKKYRLNGGTTILYEAQFNPFTKYEDTDLCKMWMVLRKLSSMDKKEVRDLFDIKNIKDGLLEYIVLSYEPEEIFSIIETPSTTGKQKGI